MPGKYTKAVLISLILLTTLLTLASADTGHAGASAEAEAGLTVDAGTTPGSLFYGLDVAMDKLRMAVTRSPEARAELGLEIAHERLLEARASAEAGNSDGTNRARREYADAVKRAEQAMGQYEGENGEAEARFQARFEKKLKAHQIAMENSAEAFVASDTELELDDMDRNMDRLRDRLREKRNQTAENMRAQGRSQTRIKASFQTAAEEENLHSFLETQAHERLEQATTCLEGTADIQVSAEKEDQYSHMLNVATFRHQQANASLQAENYGEAFGQATASWRICEAARAYAEGNNIERVRDRFRDAEENVQAEGDVHINIHCSADLEGVQARVRVSVDRNGVQSRSEFGLNVSQCPPDRELVVEQIAERTVLTREEAEIYIGPGLEIATEFRFNVDDERDRWLRFSEEMRAEFQAQFQAFQEEMMQEMENGSMEFQFNTSAEGEAESDENGTSAQVNGSMNGSFS